MIKYYKIHIRLKNILDNNKIFLNFLIYDKFHIGLKNNNINFSIR